HDAKRPDGVVDVAADDQGALPRFRPDFAFHDRAAAALAAAAVAPDEWDLDVVATIRHESGHGIDRRAVIPGDDDRLSEVGEDEAPRVLRLALGAEEPLELHATRVEAPKSR